MKLSEIKITDLSQPVLMEPTHEIYDTPERDVLVLNYTLACPLSCDFCCYGCHPKRKEKMSLDAAKDLVSQASVMENFTSIGLTGGEVFMFEEELLSLSHHIHSVGMRFTVATAAHWATTPGVADDLARTLVSNGLSRANISFDPSHAQFVPPHFVKNAALAFARLNIPVYIVGTYSNDASCLEAELPELCGSDQIKLFTKRIAKVGRARKADISYDDIETHGAKTCYRRRYHDLVVFWDGESYPCCSTFNRATKGISIGNAFEMPLEALWRRAEYSRLLKTMKSQGFQQVLQIVNQYDPELSKRLPRLEAFPGACSFCNALFSDAELARAVRSAFAGYETDKILSSLEKLNEVLGEATVAQLIRESSIRATPEGQNGGCS